VPEVVLPAWPLVDPDAPAPLPELWSEEEAPVDPLPVDPLPEDPLPEPPVCAKAMVTPKLSKATNKS
jgi:hypothetical protein